MNAITLAMATTGQVNQINRFGSDAIRKVLTEFGLDKTGAQRVIEYGDEFTEAIRTAAIASLKKLSVSNNYKNEEVDRSYYGGSFSGHMRRPKSIAEQVRILRKLFSGDIGFADTRLARRALPTNEAEGWYAIPKWQKIAPTYGKAVEKVIDKLRETRNAKFECWYGYHLLGSDYLRQTDKAKKMFQTLADQQKGRDILVVAAQLGLLHCGRSPRRAREVMQSDEVGLGAFAVGIMLLTHPERLMDECDLGIICPGDEITQKIGGDFTEVPKFYVYMNGCFRFGTIRQDGKHEISFTNIGSASAFLPKSL